MHDGLIFCDGHEILPASPRHHSRELPRQQPTEEDNADQTDHDVGYGSPVASHSLSLSLSLSLSTVHLMGFGQSDGGKDETDNAENRERVDARQTSTQW